LKIIKQHIILLRKVGMLTNSDGMLIKANWINKNATGELLELGLIKNK